MLIEYLPRGLGCLDVIPQLTSTHGKPVLTERTFQQLLAAAYTLQQHQDRLFQMVALTHEPVPEPEAIPTLKPLAVAHGNIEFLAPQRDSVIPPETAHNLSILASRLQSLLSQEIRGGSAWARIVPVASAQEVLDHDQPAVADDEMPGQTQLAVAAEEMSGQTQPALAAEEMSGQTRLPFAAEEMPGQSQLPVAEDMPGQDESAVARDAGSEKNGFESAIAEVGKDPAADSPCGSERNQYFPSRMMGHRISQSNQSFWGTATAIAASAVLCLLLVASAHRLSPLPGGLSRPPEMIQQQVPFQKTESNTAVQSRQKPIATSPRLYSTDSSDADVVTKDTVARQNTRSLASRLQAQKKSAGKAPATKVIPVQKTVVKPSRFISTSGRDVDVAAEDSLLRYDARNAAPGGQDQKK